MLDPVFIRPIAHRGLHDSARGVIENTAAAFDAAIAAGHGIECDLRPAADGLPVVFHDESLERLTTATGLVAALSAADLERVAYRNSSERVLSFSSMLAMIGGRVPLLVEIKSEWLPPFPGFLQAIANEVGAYGGPLALMSFDPAVMAAMRELAPDVPRGIVSGVYAGDDWWGDALSPERQFALSHLLESRAAAPDFYAYHVAALPTPVTRFVREVHGVPLFTWTVRSPEQHAHARRWADAPIFEGALPA